MNEHTIEYHELLDSYEDESSIFVNGKIISTLENTLRAVKDGKQVFLAIGIDHGKDCQIICISSMRLDKQLMSMLEITKIISKINSKIMKSL